MTQLPLFEPTSQWKLPDMTRLPDWSKAKRVAVDVETRDEKIKTLGIGTRRGAYIVGYGFAIEDGPKYYLPVRHQGGDNLDADMVRRYMQAQAASFTGDIVGANLSYDCEHLLCEGINFDKVKWRDVQVAEPLLDELQDRYALAELLKRYNLPGKDEELLKEAAHAYNVDPKSGLWKLPGRFVGPYGEADVDRPLKLLRKQERRIDDADLWKIWNLETDVLPVLVRMRMRGVRIDLKKLEQIETWSIAQEKEALDLVKDQTGIRIGFGDVWKSEALAPALEAIGVPLGKTAQGKTSIKKDLLAGVDHPVAAALAHARKVNKLRTTFAASVRRYMVNGRIHCTFTQMAREDEDSSHGDIRGARYGRLSCSDPNMQQQPSRDEFAKEWRSIYLAEEDMEWCSNDYSQQEPRWTTHFAAITKGGLEGALEACQAYHDDPLLDNHDFMAKLTGLKRKYAKNIFLGLCYGEGGAKLARDLGLPTRWALVARGRERGMTYFDTPAEAVAERQKRGGGWVFEAAGEEAQGIIDAFDKRAPYIRQLADYAKERANKNGFIRTAGGRMLHFPMKADGSYDWTHKSLNRLIQGTSADQVKASLVELDKRGHFLQLQVHDEIAASVKNREEGLAIADVMRNIMPAKVPFRVDTECGRSWGESMS
jgi:DNA polymerase I-like protein with 3'-5' exonuclease and polymerase domains